MKTKRGGKRPGAGRPATTGKTPARQFGRVPEAEWQQLQAAFSGIGFVAWALPMLLALAAKAKQ